jgi:hypothetical protein
VHLSFFVLSFLQNEEPAPITVTPYVLPSRGPYPRDQRKTNTVPFTPTQVLFLSVCFVISLL